MLTGGDRRLEEEDCYEQIFLSIHDGIIRHVGALGPTFLGNGHAERCQETRYNSIVCTPTSESAAMALLEYSGHRSIAMHLVRYASCASRVLDT